MKEVGKKIIKYGFKYLGYELRRIPSSSIPQIYIDPIEAVAAKEAGKGAAFCCPIEQCIIFNGLSFSSKGWHPFVAAAREYLSGRHTTFQGSILEKYYSVWQPANSLDALIGIKDGPEKLRQHPPYLVHAPWSHATHSEVMALISQIAKQEASDFGNSSITISDGYGLQGPVSYEKGRLEYFRLVSVLESIKLNGYDRSLGDIVVHVLKGYDELRFRIVHGHHRVAALAALGHNAVVVTPQMLISTDQVDIWPHVVNKTWTSSQALEYSRHLFYFNSSKWAIDLGLL